MFALSVTVIAEEEGNVYDDAETFHVFNNMTNGDKSNTWSVLLAQVIVNKINDMFTGEHKEVNNDIDIKTDNNSIVVKSISEIFQLYKLLIYDKYNVEEIPEKPRKPRNLKNPNEEFEIIEPGKCNDPDCYNDIEFIGGVENEKISGDCPEGTVKNEFGKCVQKLAKFITGVPNQCPIGYRFDRLGYCRPTF